MLVAKIFEKEIVILYCWTSFISNININVIKADFLYVKLYIFLQSFFHVYSEFQVIFSSFISLYRFPLRSSLQSSVFNHVVISCQISTSSATKSERDDDWMVWIVWSEQPPQLQHVNCCCLVSVAARPALNLCSNSMPTTARRGPNTANVYTFSLRREMSQPQSFAETRLNPSTTSALAAFISAVTNSAVKLDNDDVPSRQQRPPRTCGTEGRGTPLLVL